VTSHPLDSSNPPAALAASSAVAPTLLTERELARAARLSQAMLQKMRREGSGPAFVRVGSAVRYPAASVAAWVASLQASA
jgi:predicted DNA-binding transcriptional regulator AlpA